MTDMFITKEEIENRKEILKTDLKTVKDRMAELDKKRSEDVALCNAINGAIQQCDIFLEDLNDDKPEMASDDGNDEE